MGMHISLGIIFQCMLKVYFGKQITGGCQSPGEIYVHLESSWKERKWLGPVEQGQQNVNLFLAPGEAAKCSTNNSSRNAVSKSPPCRCLQGCKLLGVGEGIYIPSSLGGGSKAKTSGLASWPQDALPVASLSVSCKQQPEWSFHLRVNPIWAPRALSFCSDNGQWLWLGT